VIHVRITFWVVKSIITKVPGSTVVDLLLVRNQVINFLYISLEIAEVLERLILSHDRLRILVKPVFAGREGSRAS
jgi:hypothetical protein